MKKIRALISDDEPGACENLVYHLSRYAPGVEVAGVTHRVSEALEQAATEQPDVIFLDINMPGEDVFGRLAQLGQIPFEIIFVTAYDEFAAKAFRLNALDYILKPIDPEELTTAVQKLEEKMQLKQWIGLQPEQLSDAAAQWQSQVNASRIVLKNHARIDIVDFDDILLLEGMDSYTRFVYYRQQRVTEMVMSRSLNSYETLLPARLFFRTHKSYIVNTRHISAINRANGISLLVGNQFTVPVARRRSGELLNFLQCG